MGFFSKVGKVVGGALGSITGGDVLGLGASLFNTFMNANSVGDTNEANLRLWREQAAYNTPKAQMARYQAAGLNPNLIYSQGNPGNMTSSPTMQPKHYDFDPMKQFVLSATRQNLVAQNDNLHKQNTLLESQGSLAKEQARKMALENDFFEKHGQWPGTEGKTFGLGRSLFNAVEPYLKDLAGVLGSGFGRLVSGTNIVEVNMNQIPKKDREPVLKDLRDKGYKVVQVWSPSWLN